MNINSNYLKEILKFEMNRYFTKTKNPKNSPGFALKYGFRI